MRTAGLAGLAVRGAVLGIVVGWGLAGPGGRALAVGEGLPLDGQAGMVGERQITTERRGHLLTNTGVWSPDGEWIVYDTRSDPAGSVFDGETIEMVWVRTGEVRELYRAGRGAHCGVVTFHPRAMKVVFILGPEDPTPDWGYSAYHRRGVMVDVARPGEVRSLDARDLVPPFTAGALRGGSHVHVWDGEGDWVSFTYEDHVLAQFRAATATNEVNLRSIGVSVPGRPVRVGRGHPRNHDGDYFTVLGVRTTAAPRRGSDEVQRACEETWVGVRGYRRADGGWQRRALAFQGTVVDERGGPCVEVFVVDLPEDVTVPGEGPLEGTATQAPRPPRGAVQRRLTFTTGRKYPGVQGMRHWLRTTPDGSQVGFLMRDEWGVVQLWTVSPNGGAPRQVTSHAWDIASAFTFSPDGRWVAHLMDGSVCVTELATGQTRRLTVKGDPAVAPRPEAVVFSPDGGRVAYVRPVLVEGRAYNQVFVVEVGR